MFLIQFKAYKRVREQTKEIKPPLPLEDFVGIVRIHSTKNIPILLVRTDPLFYFFFPFLVFLSDPRTWSGPRENFSYFYFFLVSRFELSMLESFFHMRGRIGNELIGLFENWKNVIKYSIKEIVFSVNNV